MVLILKARKGPFNFGYLKLFFRSSLW
jgi:hypothetical protein